MENVRTDGLLEKAIDILRDLVSFDTVSSSSNYDAISYVYDYFVGLGARAVIVQAKDQEKQNLWVTFGEGSDDGIVFSGHIDVVPVSGQKWQQNPFAMTREGDRLYGRGTTDMKGFLACVMAVASQIDIAALKRPVHVAVTFDEEIGCIGANELVDFLKEEGIRPAAFFVGEPTNMNVVDRHKGSAGFTTTVRGKAVHSSNMQLGLSAIQVAAELIGILTSIAAELRRGEGDDSYSYPYPSINVGVIRGGEVRNIVAPECSFDWDLRPIVPDHFTKVEHAFDAHVANKIAEAKEKGDLVPSVETVCVWNAPPLVADPQSIATAMALSLTGNNVTHALSFGTEAGIYQMAGIPAVVCGPGNIEQAHTPDEWIEVGELEACLAFLQRLTAAASRDVVTR